MKVAVITGGSSGIGLGAVKSLLEKGCKVYELSRRDFEYKDVTHIKLDVTDEVETIKVISSIIDIEGKIDILINSAGFGISGAIEFTELEDVRKQMDVNFYGVVNATYAVLPYMRKQGAGRIVNISSVAALAPIPFQAYYSVSKSAINTFTGALANEVKPFGITVTSIMPGDVKTNFTEAREKSVSGDAEYDGRISRSVKKMEQDEINGMDADVAGGFVAKIALKKNVKTEYSIGVVNNILCILCRFLPIRLKFLIIWKLYGCAK